MTPIGRVCGTVIGAEYSDTVRPTSKRSTRSAMTPENASQRKSGSGPDSSRKGLPALSRTTLRVSSSSSISASSSPTIVMVGRRER